jgi:hypothetical protein
MKTSAAMMALVVGLSTTAATEAQLFRRDVAPNPRTVPTPKPISTTPAQPATGSGGLAGTRDPNVTPSNVVIPPPVNPNDLAPPNFPLPTEPIEPYLLTQEAGPFMVHAHTFKGPHAEKLAQALAMELRTKHNLPAYVFRPKDFPMRSMIRNVPPTAPRGMNRAMLSFPEMERVKDEAAVLVGNAKTLEDSEKLLHQVKKLRPATMENLADWHPGFKGKGLSRALRTTNPYAPAEVLFPRKPDVMIVQMNQGPHSIFTCPGRYSLQISQFSGRANLGDAKIVKESKFNNMLSLRESPLKTAHEDAEKLAAALAKDKNVMQGGYVPYVYHDRFSSKVYIGAFNDPKDPNVVKLRDHLLRMAGDLNNRKVTDVLIVPATALTDVTEIKRR